MSHDAVHQLLQIGDTPLVAHVSSPADFEELAQQLEDHGATARRMQGSAMTTLDDLFEEVSRALFFPNYFGRNWDALDECLVDLSWLPAPAYVLLIDGALDVLRDEPVEQLETFLRILARAAADWAVTIELGEPWDRPAAPFHTVFHELRGREAALLQRYEHAGVALDLLA
jgi:barstar (barnase inhibitor)